VIGDREDRPDDAMMANRGPMDYAVRLSSPDPAAPPVWVERYGQAVVVRHTWPDGDTTRETFWPTEAQALREYAVEVARLIHRGFTRMKD
jgi:hypothetical protein